MSIFGASGFRDMSQAYDRKLIALAEKAAKAAGIPIRKGVYVGLKGPSMETPAEIRFLRTRAPKLWVFHRARGHCGGPRRMQVLGISIITNVNDPDRPVPAALENQLPSPAGQPPLWKNYWKAL